MILQFKVTINDKGEITNFNRQQFIQQLQLLSGSDAMLIVKPIKTIRGLSLNNYYFGVVVKMVMNRVRDLGNDWNAKRTHDYLKDRFVPDDIDFDLENGSVIITNGSTSSLTNKQFTDYIERIIQWAAEVLDIQIPFPGEWQEGRPSLNSINDDRSR